MLKIGDTIQCHDIDDMVDTMQELAKGGVITDFLYGLNGKRGYWLIVTGLEEDNE